LNAFFSYSLVPIITDRSEERRRKKGSKGDRIQNAPNSNLNITGKGRRGKKKGEKEEKDGKIVVNNCGRGRASVPVRGGGPKGGEKRKREEKEKRKGGRKL